MHYPRRLLLNCAGFSICCLFPCSRACIKVIVNADSNGMKVIMRILRHMAIESKGTPGLNYRAFRNRLSQEDLTPNQRGPLKLRLDLLESFMYGVPPVSTDATQNAKRAQLIAQQNEAWNFPAGSLTIVDLSCPFVDENAACMLFSIVLDLFLERRGSGCGRIIALDEAHKYVTGTPAASTFTENLLQVVRLQRHLGARVVISTQEPTISPHLIDLASVTIVHRFTSPAWMATLKEHLAGATMGTSEDGEQAEGNRKRRAAQIFAKIVTLDAGEALLFSPATLIDVRASRVSDRTWDSAKLGSRYLKIRVRNRLTADGGRSILAV